MKKSASLGWLVPLPFPGSGGHRTILAHIHALSLQGHDCHIYLEGVQTRKQAEKWVRFCVSQDIHATYHPGWQIMKKHDLLLATIWYSARIVKEDKGSAKKAYFIQDYEPYFYSMGSLALQAIQSYRFGLIPITIGHFLPHLLAQEFQLSSYFCPLGVNRTIYHNQMKTREKAIVYLYQPEKERRAAELGLEALRIVHAYSPQTKIYLYGSPIMAHHIPFPVVHLGVQSPAQCNAIYNQVKVGLCISATNPSRVPIEMMAAGLPVVDIYGKNNWFDFPECAGILADLQPSSIASALIYYLECTQTESNPKKLSALENFLSQRTEQMEQEKSAEAICDILSDSPKPPALPARLYRKKPFCASEEFLSKVMPVLAQQATIKNSHWKKTYHQWKTKIKRKIQRSYLTYLG